jgi:hypothetical protein
MKRFAYLGLAAAMFFVTSSSFGAIKLKTEGQAWLDVHTDPAAINVEGNWYARDWGTIALIQPNDSREVTGSGDGWEVVGVVSGKKVYLLFCSRGDAVYSAIVTSVSNSEMDGNWERGLMKEEGKGKRMIMTK